MQILSQFSLTLLGLSIGTALLIPGSAEAGRRLSADEGLALPAGAPTLHDE